MIDYNSLQYGDTIWQIDINGTDVMLRKIEVGHLHQIAGSYWISAEQEGSFDGIMLKADSHLLFYTKSEAIDFAIDLRDNLSKVIREPL
jgi:hypothetical protein